MKIKLIEENYEIESLASNPLILLADEGTYMINLPLDEVKSIIRREGFDIYRIASPQTFLMVGLRESMKKKRK